VAAHVWNPAGQLELETNSRDGEEDLSDSILSGYLKLMEIDGSWTRHFFTLTVGTSMRPLLPALALRLFFPCCYYYFC
jgi:hypothetical protein